MYSTRATKKARMTTVRDRALRIVLHSDFVPWYEAVKVGQTNKVLRVVWQQRKDQICEPVLEALNDLGIASNVCRACLKVSYPASERECDCGPGDEDTPLAHLDPRSGENYAQLSTWKKCKAVVEFTALLVKNFRSNFDFDNLTDGAGLPPDFVFEWQTRQFELLAEEKPRRLAFMTKFVAANRGQNNLYGGIGISRFNDAFAGTGFDPDDVEAVEEIEETLCCIIPPTNRVFEDMIHQLRSEEHGYPKVWETLGPVLTRKLDFLAPFVNLDDGRAIIPEDMEPISKEEDEWFREQMYWRYE